MKGTLKYHPFLLYAVLGVVFEAIVGFWAIDYDAGGVKGSIFWIGQVFSFAFWIPSEILFSLNHGQAVRFHTAISIVFKILNLTWGKAALNTKESHDHGNVESVLDGSDFDHVLQVLSRQ